MQIEMHEITVRDLIDGYVDRDEDGVIGYGGSTTARIVDPLLHSESLSTGSGESNYWDSDSRYTQ